MQRLLYFVSEKWMSQWHDFLFNTAVVLFVGEVRLTASTRNYRRYYTGQKIWIKCQALKPNNIRNPVLLLWNYIDNPFNWIKCNPNKKTKNLQFHKSGFISPEPSLSCKNSTLSVRRATIGNRSLYLRCQLDGKDHNGTERYSLATFLFIPVFSEFDI